MKIDYSPLNEEQVATMKAILNICKNFVHLVSEEMKKCPGLMVKGFKIDLSIDPGWETIGKQIEFSRKVIADNQIKAENYYIQRGFDEYDEGWNRQTALCTKEFADLLESNEDTEGTGEGTGS